MSNESRDIVYLCPNCFTPADTAGTCRECGTEVVEFCPGGANDMCRRPVINSRGEVCTHVPLWWIRKVAPDLADRLEEHMDSSNETQ